MTLEKRIERQKRLVETLGRRLAFEELVLQRLEARKGASEPKGEPPRTIADVVRAARLRAAR